MKIESQTGFKDTRCFQEMDKVDLTELFEIPLKSKEGDAWEKSVIRHGIGQTISWKCNGEEVLSIKIEPFRTTLSWISGGKLHNGAGPAFLAFSGKDNRSMSLIEVGFYRNGLLHRDENEGPAYLDYSSLLIWYKNGQKHRSNGLPCLEHEKHPYEKREYAENGKLIREEIPSIYGTTRIVEYNHDEGKFTENVFDKRGALISQQVKGILSGVEISEKLSASSVLDNVSRIREKIKEKASKSVSAFKP